MRPRSTSSCAPIYGRMFWLSRKKFVGSCLRLSARSHSLADDVEGALRGTAHIHKAGPH